MRLIHALVLGLLAAAGVGSVQASGSVLASGSPNVKIELSSGGHGSGVHIGKGYILTAGHVVSGENEVTVRDRNKNSWTGQVQWSNTRDDFGLVKITEYAALPVSQVDCREPNVGEDIVASGYPDGLGYMDTRGYVSGGSDRRGSWLNSWVFVGPVMPGSSGSPVYSKEGKVIGLVVGGIPVTGFGINILSPVKVVCGILPVELK